MCITFELLWTLPILYVMLNKKNKFIQHDEVKNTNYFPKIKIHIKNQNTKRFYSFPKNTMPRRGITNFSTV